MTLSQWAEAAGVGLPPPNDKGHVLVEIEALDSNLKADLLRLDDFFLQSPPRHQFDTARVVWMKQRAQVLDRAPQPQEATSGQVKARSRRAT